MSVFDDENKVTYFAQTDSRNKRVPFGIKKRDRSRHMYVIGKTGMGKSTLLENMAIQDIRNGEGMAFVDPHGKTAELLLEYVPEERMKDVLYFAPFDTDYPVSFNIMEDIGADKRHLVANGLMSTFEKIWVDAWSARMAYILNNTLLALLEYPGSTLLGINRMLSDKEYRKRVVEHVSDPSVKSFWVDEFAKYTDRYAQEATPAIQNKVGQFTSNPLIRNIIGQPKSTFNIREMMDNRKILIINLSKGRVGEGNASLLGSMLITKIYLSAMSRADVSERVLNTLPHFYVYVDEFQSFANKSFADILSEARKYKLDLTITHQYIEQMEEEVRAAVFGNVGTMVTFRVGAFDAEVLEKEFAPQFTIEDLVNLGVFQIYLKLMIDGVGSAPFSATTLSPIERPLVSLREKIINLSRATYARPRSAVEEEIKIWHQPILPAEKPKDKGVKAAMPIPPAPTPSSAPPAPHGAPIHSATSQNRVPAEQKVPPQSLPQPPKRIDAPRPPNAFHPDRAARPAPPLPRIHLNELRSVAKGQNIKKVQEENLSELRKALSAVLAGEVKPVAAPQEAAVKIDKQKSPEASPVKEEPKSNRGAAPTGDARPAKEASRQDNRRADKPENIQKNPPSRPTDSTPRPTGVGGFSRSPVREVPEEVLRGILRVDDDSLG